MLLLGWSWISLLLSSASLLHLSSAISRQDAGVHDWHTELIGQPDVQSPWTSPRFHYPAGPKRSSVSALVYTATHRNVLAALEPRGGQIAWRQPLSDDQTILRYVLHGNYILALTGPGASLLHLFSASTGHSIWTVVQHTPEHGLLPEPGRVAADAVFFELDTEPEGAFDVLSISNGKEISRIDGKTGTEVWRQQVDTSADPTLQAHAIIPPAKGASTVAVLLTRRDPNHATYTLSTISLDAQTGALLDSTPKAIKGVSLATTRSLLVLPPLPQTAESRAVLIDAASGQLKTMYFVVTGEREVTVSTYKDKTQKAGLRPVEIVPVDLASRGLFVTRWSDGTSSIMESTSAGTIRQLHTWSDPAPDAVFSGFLDRDGKAHVSRYSISKILGMASMSTYTVDGSEHAEAGTVFASTFAYSVAKYGRMLHATAEVAPRTSPTLLARVCVTTSSGSLQGWMGTQMQWERHEGLAHIASVGEQEDGLPPTGRNAVAFLPLTGQLEPAAKLRQADSLPLQKLISVGASLLSPVTDLLRQAGLLKPITAVSTGVGRDWLADAFNYRKVVLAATPFGRLYALDLGNGGKILWDHFLLPLAGESDSQGYKSVVWKKLAVFDDRTDGRVLVIAVAAVTNYENRAYTLAIYLDGLTGKLFDEKLQTHDVVVQSAVHSAWVLHGSQQPTLALLDYARRVHLFSPPHAIAGSGSAGQDLPALSLLDTAQPGLVRGLRALLSSGNNPVLAEETWRLPLAATERITSLARQTNGKVASMGRVLGDRSTLYKYLNPHLVVFATVDDTLQSATVNLLDIATGKVVWSASQPDIDVKAGVQVTLAENWLVYTFASKTADGRVGQTVVVSVELFQPGEKPAASQGENDEIVTVFSRSFILPVTVTTLSTSTTVHGVTTKALLVGTWSGQIIAVPRRLLDPRRPLHKPTKADMEEYLIPYDPVIAIDPKWIITHSNHVPGITEIFTSPTLLESTSQVFAIGLELFGSSVSPSGRFDVLSREFNKFQLVATSLALLGAIAVMRPIVERKQLKERWYPAS